MCPQCKSDNLSMREYDYGKECETGYHDAGMTYTCLDCGSVTEADEMERFMGEQQLSDEVTRV